MKHIFYVLFVFKIFTSVECSLCIAGYCDHKKLHCKFDHIHPGGGMLIVFSS